MEDEPVMEKLVGKNCSGEDSICIDSEFLNEFDLPGAAIYKWPRGYIIL